MIYPYKIPKYINKHFATIEFNELFILQFFKNDAIAIDFDSKTQDYGYEKYVKNLYTEIIKRFKQDNNYEELIQIYQRFKASYSVYYRWNIYESFVHFLIEKKYFEEALKEWTLLQEEEWSGFNMQFTYRESAILMLSKLECLVNRSIVNGYYIQKMAFKGSQLTEFGKRNYSEVMKTLDVMLNNEYEISFFEDFWADYNFEENDYHPYEAEHYIKFFNHSSKSWKKWQFLFNEGSHVQEYVKKDGKAKSTLIFAAIREKCSFLLREAENKYRLSIGAKKIGESWISETELFYKLKKSLQEEVIHHGRPKWLGRQHFDIWIPELNVAIEYQGKQHDQPIEFFGGEEAFKENQKRDARKKKKCEENNVRLIEVREGYDLDELVKEILH